MGKWIKIILILAIAGIIAAVLVFKFYINKPHQDIENAKAEYSFKADELYTEFKNNNLADSLYVDKVIEISGLISKIETPSDSLVVAVFSQKNDTSQTNTDDLFAELEADGGIRCSMLFKFNEETKKIEGSSPVKIKGLCIGKQGSDIIFEKCVIVK
jgi:hypothetical protein